MISVIGIGTFASFTNWTHSRCDIVKPSVGDLAAEPPRFAFVRGFGGTGTGLLARVLGTHTRISTMTHTRAMYEDEGQYLQSAMPEIRKRTAESCGGSIAVCPRIVDALPRDARVNVCAGWAPWWDATKDVLVEKTPDLAARATSR